MSQVSELRRGADLPEAASGAMGRVEHARQSKLDGAEGGHDLCDAAARDLGHGSGVAAFEGDVQFNISIKRIGVTHNVPIDLADMGAQPRSMANVISYINDQLAAAGVETRFQTQRTARPAADPQRGRQDGHLAATTPDQLALKVNGRHRPRR